MTLDKSEPEAFLDGRFIPQSAARIPVYDAGFMLGATVSEQLPRSAANCSGCRSIWRGSKSRSPSSGRNCRWRLPNWATSPSNWSRNHELLAEGDDLGLSMFVTPGPYATLAGRDVATSGPTVGLHTYPLPYQLWREKYTSGERLVTPQIRQVPPECWPAQLKCRSRMHYYLADKEAGRAARQPRS